MSSSRILIILVCTLIGASAGTVFQALRITRRPQQFRSQAKLIVGEIEERDPIDSWREGYGFYERMLEPEVIDGLKQPAADRVKASNPTFQIGDVNIALIPIERSIVIQVLATGKNPEDTRLFLNALLNELIARHKSIGEQAQRKVLGQALTEIDLKRRLMEEFSVRLERVRQKAGLQQDEAAELKKLEQGRQSIQVRYETAFERVKTFLSEQSPGRDHIAILERATPAFEIVEEWRLPVALTAVGGGLIGLVLSLLLVRSPKPPQRPNAVG